MQKPVAVGGETYNQRLSGDQQAQPPPSVTLWELVPSAFINQASTFHPVELRFTYEMYLPSGDHTGTPSVTAGSCSKVSWRLCLVAISSTQRLPCPPLSLR